MLIMMMLMILHTITFNIHYNSITITFMGYRLLTAVNSVKDCLGSIINAQDQEEEEKEERERESIITAQSH